jgi:hypothetical protein
MGCFSGSESKSQSTSYIPKQEEYLNKALDFYGNLLGKNENVYKGDRVADFTGLQNEAISGAGNFANIFSTPQTADAPLMGETQNAIGRMLAGQGGAAKLTQDQANNYFDTAVVNPTMKGFKQEVLPGIDESFAGGDFFSSARGKMRTKAATDVTDMLTQQRSNFNWDVLKQNQALDEAAAGRTQTAINQGMNFSQLPAQNTLNNLRIAAGQIQGLSDIFGFGQEQQTQQQREIEMTIAKFAEENQITDPDNMAILLSLLNMNYGSASSSSSGPGLGYALGASAAGSFGKAAGTGMAGMIGF